MNTEQTWMATEERLLREAGSLGDLLEKLRPRISPALIAGSGWEELLARARSLPATLGAFPVGFELPLHEPRPNADFWVSLVGGSRSAEFFEQRSRGENADSGVARLLDGKSREKSPLRRVTGTKMLLEYDIDSAENGLRPDPGAFLYPTERPLYGREARERLADVEVMLDGLSATGWDWNAAERREVERAYLALTPEARILSLGAFPARKRGVRFAAAGFGTTRHIAEFLRRMAWPGSHASAQSLLSRLEACNSAGHIAVHFDVRADGLGPKLGLSLYARDGKWLKEGRYWLDDPGNWTAFMEDMRKDPMVAAGKLPALANWSSEAATLFGKSGVFALIRGIHHVKLVVAGDRLEQIKAYVFLMMCGVSKDKSGLDFH